MKDKIALEEHFAIDGCKLASNASKQWSGTHEELRHKQEKMEAAARRIVGRHRARDQQEATGPMAEPEQKKLFLDHVHISRTEIASCTRAAIWLANSRDFCSQGLEIIQRPIAGTVVHAEQFNLQGDGKHAGNNLTEGCLLVVYGHDYGKFHDGRNRHSKGLGENASRRGNGD